nr:tRNA (adenosine(37)-N6)-dimethylallyltransferase MiaA [Paracoccaceae bacterium]
VLAATGRGLAAWQREAAAPILRESEAVCVICMPDMKSLNNSIEKRFHRIVEYGALEECRRFRDGGLDRGLPAARALGAAELIAHLNGELTRAEAVERAVTATRRYAKRQRTWFRNRMAAWPRIEAGAPDALDRICRR